MFVSNFEMRCDPAALTLFLILIFYDFAIVLFKNSEVAHKYRNSSGEIPIFYRSSHFR
jgi:hypothetical protein